MTGKIEGIQLGGKLTLKVSVPRKIAEQMDEQSRENPAMFKGFMLALVTHEFEAHLLAGDIGLEVMVGYPKSEGPELEGPGEPKKFGFRPASASDPSLN